MSNDIDFIPDAVKMLALLRECVDVLDHYADVNDGDGRQVANAAMALQQRIEVALVKAERR